MVTRRGTVAISSIFAGAFLLLLLLGLLSGGFMGSEGGNLKLASTHHRKLLLLAKAMVEPNRIVGDKCTTSDISIFQGPAASMPSGIPMYNVQIINSCVSGCSISGIHLNCGWFSSANRINPKLFKRVYYNDCLVNNGKPLANGGSISFQYASTFLYPLSVSKVIC